MKINKMIFKDIRAWFMGYADFEHMQMETVLIPELITKIKIKLNEYEKLLDKQEQNILLNIQTKISLTNALLGFYTKQDNKLNEADKELARVNAQYRDIMFMNELIRLYS